MAGLSSYAYLVGGGFGVVPGVVDVALVWRGFDFSTDEDERGEMISRRVRARGLQRRQENGERRLKPAATTARGGAGTLTMD